MTSVFDYPELCRLPDGSVVRRFRRYRLALDQVEALMRAALAGRRCHLLPAGSSRPLPGGWDLVDVFPIAGTRDAYVKVQHPDFPVVPEAVASPVCGRLVVAVEE